MNILEFAMEKEKFSKDYYRRLADRSTSKGLMEIFNMLADEEAKHYKIIKQLKDKVPETAADTDVLSDAKDIFKRMRENAGEFNFDENELGIYKKAQDIEKESREFYLEKASQVDDPYQKRIFRRLAAEEKKHFFLLDNIIEFVSRPQQWLENAEFVHLDEY